MYEEYEYLNYEFPTKEEISSLRKKRERMRKNYFRMRRLVENPHCWDVCCYNDNYGNWCKRDEAVYMKRYYRRKNESKWLKQQCNRKFRRKGIVTSKRGAQHKMTEFWWMYY